MLQKSTTVDYHNIGRKLSLCKSCGKAKNRDNMICQKNKDNGENMHFCNQNCENKWSQTRPLDVRRRSFKSPKLDRKPEQKRMLKRKGNNTEERLPIFTKKLEDRSKSQ